MRLLCVIIMYSSSLLYISARCRGKFKTAIMLSFVCIMAVILCGINIRKLL